MSVFGVAELIAKQTAAERDRTAVAFRDSRLSFAELEELAARVAGGLDAAGFRRGDRLGVLMHNRLEWPALFFAVARLGGVVVPLNQLLTAAELGFMIEDSGARWLCAEDGLWDRVEDLPAGVRNGLRTIVVGEARPDALGFESLGESDPAPRADVAGDDLFLLQYTSGTTGKPKAASHTQATVMWNAVSQRPHFGLGADTVYLCLPALSWVAGFHSLMLETLWSGGTVVLNPTGSGFDPAEFCATVAREGVTTLAAVPTVLRRIVDSPALAEHDLSSLRLAVAGGEAVPVQLLEDLADRLPQMTTIQVYGMSEFPSLLTLLEPEFAATKLGSAGRPNCVSQIRVVTADGGDCAPEEVGEILSRSPATMVGYYRRPEASEEALAGGWLHTGDLGRLDADGFLYISGRSKDLIISGGLNVYPAEVEAELLRHPAVAEAAVVGMPSEEWGEIGKAFVVLAEGEEAGEEELRAALSERLARYKLPKQWEIRRGPPLPRTASGKLQKFKLREA